MRKIEAIIRSTKLQEVKDALELAGYDSLTVSDVKGRGKQKGIVQQWRCQEYCVDLLPKTKIEIVVPEYNVEEIIDIIQKQAATGSIGDGKIFVYVVEMAVRIRTGERDGDAI